MMTKDNNNGFTLIELLLALVIALILIPSIFLIYISSHRCYIMNESIIDMHQNARVSMEFITRELKNSCILDLEDANTISFYTFTDTTFTGTSTGNNTSLTLNDTEQEWDPNGWRGVLVGITGGTGKGQVGTIESNGSTQLRLKVETEWDVTPDVTSVYRLDIEEKGFKWPKKINANKKEDILLYKKGNSGYYPFANNISYVHFDLLDEIIGQVEIKLVARTSRKDPKDNEYHTYNLKSIVIIRN
ncbi:MAG: prepilin-type N-terminal cleavage/methylation domain-containing protein [bacterium]